MPKETWLDGQHSELFLSALQKLEFGRCSLFPSWSGKDLPAARYTSVKMNLARLLLVCFPTPEDFPARMDDMIERLMLIRQRRGFCRYFLTFWRRNYFFNFSTLCI